MKEKLLTQLINLDKSGCMTPIFDDRFYRLLTGNVSVERDSDDLLTKMQIADEAYLFLNGYIYGLFGAGIINAEQKDDMISNLITIFKEAMKCF